MMSHHKQSELDQDQQSVTTDRILEAAHAVLTVTRTTQNLVAASEEDPTVGYDSPRRRTFVLFTEL